MDPGGLIQHYELNIAHMVGECETLEMNDKIF